MTERENEPSAARPRVLLADDHATLLAALTRLVGGSCEVVGAVRNGAEALAAAARLQPDVIVMDVRLPDIDGLEVCRRVTTSALRSRVIILTAADDPGVKQRAFAVGASGFVVKHRVGDDLLRAIATARTTTPRDRRADSPRTFSGQPLT